MREIKFRAYLKKDKAVVHVHNIDFEYYRIFHDSVDYRFILDTTNNPEDYILMQYTGIKDSEGIDIYEGDIIQNNENFGVITSWQDAVDNHPDKRIVIWCNDECRFTWDYLTKSIRGRGTSGYTFSKGNEKIFKIVGNIYQNPELLEQTNE